jgi:nicotinamide mononucleotide adenylyltransferase
LGNLFKKINKQILGCKLFINHLFSAKRRTQMTLDDLEEIAIKSGLRKSKKNWYASQAQLEQFANSMLAEFRQIATDRLITSIKKAADYEREQCAKVAEMAWFNGIELEQVASAIRERKDA